MRKTFIYGLKEPNGEIRYVGKADDVNRRLRQHKSNARKEKSHKVSWIKSCLNRGIDIELVILEEVGYDVWHEREVYWIKQFHNLTNHNKGGKGGKPEKYNLSYVDCKNWVLENLPNISSQSLWYKNINNLPDFISPYPYDTYKYRGWISWGDFLNTERVADQYRVYMSYDKAKEWCLQNNIKSQKQYKLSEKPINLPYKAERTYRNNGWVNWFDFLSK